MEALIFIAVLLLTQFIKKYVAPKWGSTGVHILTFIIAVIGLGIYQYATTNTDFMDIVMQALQFLAGAVALYEVILKKIGFKSFNKQILDQEAGDNR